VTRRHNRSERKKPHNTISTKAQRSSPRGQATSRNPNSALFPHIFSIFFLILHHLDWKHTNFQLNWTEGVAYINSTIFGTKLRARSWLWVRCLRSRIWASSRGQHRLGRHNRSQRKKQHNTISTKAQRSSPRGQATSRNSNFALFAPIFLIFFLFFITQIGAHQFSTQLDKGVPYRNATIFSMKCKAPSRLWAKCLRSRIWASSRLQHRLGRHSRSQRKTQHNTINKNVNRAHHEVRPLVQI
jgi:hypothetical protein